MSVEQERILVTGATGFLGREIVTRLLHQFPTAKCLLPIRPKRGRSAQQRAEREVVRSLPPAEREDAMRRLEFFEGDLRCERMGLPEDRYQSLAETTTRVIHSAADVQFDSSLSEARAINVGGVETALAWARTARQGGALKSFTHVSTAFVAGERVGTALETELDVGQGFRNAYEQSKCEAEKLVHQVHSELPALVVRPSIIVGDSRTGMTTSFKAMYWPLKIYASGRWRLVPGRPDAVADIVPVNFVADATLHLAFQDEALGRCFHLCAGPEGNATLKKMAGMAADFFDVPPPRFISPTVFAALIRPVLLATLWGSKRSILRTGKVYRPYFSMRVEFDTTQACEQLAPAGITAPPVSDYILRLFDYCRKTDWGKRPYRG